MQKPTLISGRREARYRRLLWAYPRAYRSRHGAEIVTTMLDLADARRGQELHLVLCGLRQRFRLPAGRPLAWLGAVLAAVALGAFGAAAGTWLGWQTAASIPADRELRALNAAATGMPAPAAVYRDRSAMQGPGALVRADGTGDYSAERIRVALTSAGWRITSFHEIGGATRVDVGSAAEKSIPTRLLDFTAARGDLKLAGQGSVITGEADQALSGQASYDMEVWPHEPAAARPSTIAGLLVGALAGWWTAAALAHRMRRLGRLRRGTATTLSTVALAAAAVPAYAHYRDAYQVMVYAHGSPYPYVVDSPSDQLPVLAWTIAGLVAVVAVLVATAPRRRSETPVLREVAGA